MFQVRGSPVARLLVVVALGLAAAVLALTAVLESPWVDRPGRPNAIGAPGEAAIAATPADLTEEPDTLPTYADMASFFARQDRLSEALAGPHVVWTEGARADTLPVLRRPVTSLPPAFWVQLATGVGGLLIGGWIWALRPQDSGTRFFALSGLGLMASALPAAVYSSRQLALDGELFRLLSGINHVGALVFAAAMIDLFLVYPRRLVGARGLAVAPALLALVGVTSELRLGPGAGIGFYLPVLLSTLAILALIGVQWRATARDPQGRAALTWLGLSVGLGCSGFVAVAAAPAILGLPAPPQGYAFAVFLVIYAGLALGLTRTRLFEVGDWAFRVLFFAVGVIMLLALDAALVALLHWGPSAALGAALVVVGFLYLPLRDLLWRRLTRRRGLPNHELFDAALGVAFDPDPGARGARWRALLRQLFDPLEIEPAAQAPAAVRIEEEGLGMTLPAIADSPALRLRYPGGGRALFSPGQLKLASQLVALTRQAEASRQAHERGAAEERGRLARDLHDDVAARLLSGLHTADDRTRPILHAALGDIRAIVSGLAGRRAPLEQVLADIRHETARRLEAAGVELDWPLSEAEPGAVLDYPRHKALTSAMREAVTNAIRHADAARVTVRVAFDRGWLTATVADDGRGMSAPQAGEGGHGLASMARRMADVGGRFEVSGRDRGATVTLEMPVPVLAAPAEAAA